MIRPESTRITFFAQNRAKPNFTGKIDQNHCVRPKSTKATFFGQNRPKPVFSVKIDHKFFRSKLVFPVKINQNHFYRPKLTKTSFFGQHLVFFPAKIDEDQFFRPKSTKTTFLGQIWPTQVVTAKIDQNHIVRAENRKLKTVKLRPKRDKQTPFSLVLIPSLDCRAKVRSTLAGLSNY